MKHRKIVFFLLLLSYFKWLQNSNPWKMFSQFWSFNQELLVDTIHFPRCVYFHMDHWRKIALFKGSLEVRQVTERCWIAVIFQGFGLRFFDFLICQAWRCFFTLLRSTKWSFFLKIPKIATPALIMKQPLVELCFFSFMFYTQNDTITGG